MLDKTNVIKNLKEFDDQIGLTFPGYKLELIVFGGSAIILNYNPDFRVTIDIDVVGWEEQKVQSLKQPLIDLMYAYNINDNIGIHLSVVSELEGFKENIVRFEGIEFENIIVNVPTPTLITFTKFLAWRRGTRTRNDADDVAIPQIYNNIDYDMLSNFVHEFMDYDIEFNGDERRTIYLKDYENFLEEIKEKNKNTTI